MAWYGWVSLGFICGTLFLLAAVGVVNHGR